MRKVRDVMATEMCIVSPSTPAIEVAHQMKIRGEGVVGVCSRGRFRGLITERDVVARVVANASDPITKPASSMMNKDHPSVSTDIGIVQAVRTMATSGVRVLPVVNEKDNKLVGLLTLDDLARESLSLAAMVLCGRPGIGNTKEDKVKTGS